MKRKIDPLAKGSMGEIMASVMDKVVSSRKKSLEKLSARIMEWRKMRDACKKEDTAALAAIERVLELDEDRFDGLQKELDAFLRLAAAEDARQLAVPGTEKKK